MIEQEATKATEREPFNLRFLRLLLFNNNPVMTGIVEQEVTKLTEREPFNLRFLCLLLFNNNGPPHWDLNRSKRTEGQAEKANEFPASAMTGTVKQEATKATEREPFNLRFLRLLLLEMAVRNTVSSTGEMK